MVASDQLVFLVSTEFLLGVQSRSLSLWVLSKNNDDRRRAEDCDERRYRSDECRASLISNGMEPRRKNVDKQRQIMPPFVMQASMMSRIARSNWIRAPKLTRAHECAASGQCANDCQSHFVVMSLDRLDRRERICATRRSLSLPFDDIREIYREIGTSVSGMKKENCGNGMEYETCIPIRSESSLIC